MGGRVAKVASVSRVRRGRCSNVCSNVCANVTSSPNSFRTGPFVALRAQSSAPRPAPGAEIAPAARASLEPKLLPESRLPAPPASPDPLALRSRRSATRRAARESVPSLVGGCPRARRPRRCGTNSPRSARTRRRRGPTPRCARQDPAVAHRPPRRAAHRWTDPVSSRPSPAGEPLHDLREVIGGHDPSNSPRAAIPVEMQHALPRARRVSRRLRTGPDPDPAAAARGRERASQRLENAVPSRQERERARNRERGC